MTSKKIRAGRRGWDIAPVSGVGFDGARPPGSPASPDVDQELEAEVAAVAAFFATLPRGLQAFLDREARTGSAAYRWS